MRNLETLFRFHAKRDTRGDGCFLFVRDAIRLATNDFGQDFKPPKYLDGVSLDKWVETARHNCGSLEIGWREYLDRDKRLERVPLDKIEPGNIAITGGENSVICIISQGYEPVARTNFGLTVVHGIKYAWRVKI